METAAKNTLPTCCSLSLTSRSKEDVDKGRDVNPNVKIFTPESKVVFLRDVSHRGSQEPEMLRFRRSTAAGGCGWTRPGLGTEGSPRSPAPAPPTPPSRSRPDLGGASRDPNKPTRRGRGRRGDVTARPGRRARRTLAEGASSAEGRGRGSLGTLFLGGRAASGPRSSLPACRDPRRPSRTPARCRRAVPEREPVEPVGP